MEISEFKGETIEEDILKRDFTINGIAMDKDGNIIDPYNFQTDINQKRISLIDKTGESIRINPLLILRAIRLACQLDFEIEEETKEQMKKNKLTIARIIGQRVYIELAKMIVTDKFPKYLDEYFDIFIMILPELININFEDMQKRNRLLSVMPNNIALKLAALFSYNGNPTQDFTQFANRMMLDKKTTKLVLTLLSYKDKDININKNGINRVIYEFNVQNVDLLFAYKKALMSVNHECTVPLDRVRELYQIVVDQVIQSKISNLQINTDRLIEMGYSKEDATLILEDVKGRVIRSTLQNDERSINSYILNNYKRS
jgi:tRNA nucleotidyltransferase (CCA-adding enzyme)